MTYIVGEGCINCKHTDCVEVCPVDCFYEGSNFMVIDPMNVLTALFASLSARKTRFILKMKHPKIRKSFWNSMPSWLKFLRESLKRRNPYLTSIIGVA